MEGRRAEDLVWFCWESVVWKENENGEVLDSGEKPKVFGEMCFVPVDLAEGRGIRWCRSAVSLESIKDRTLSRLIQVYFVRPHACVGGLGLVPV